MISTGVVNLVARSTNLKRKIFFDRWSTTKAGYYIVRLCLDKVSGSSTSRNY